MRLAAVGFVVAAALAAPSVALAQEGVGSISTVEGDVDGRALDARARRMLQRICWQRGDAVGAEWMAEHNPGYRQSVLSRYVAEAITGGWRWLPAASVRAGDLRASGYTDRVLDVHPQDGGIGWARLDVTGPLRTGAARLEWTLPPERLCMIDDLDLRAEVRVEHGDPGEAAIAFVLPLSSELMAVEGAEVKACSPTGRTLIDAAGGQLGDAGRCRRSLLHLTEGAEWALWVSLPESAYVVYPYRPVTR